MKILRTILLSVALISAPAAIVTTSGCSTTQQSTTYKTLAAVGEAADVTMTQAAQARHLNQITDAQWQDIKRVHDVDFQPEYNLAVDAAASSSAPAPSAVIALSARLAALLTQYLPKTN